MRRMHRFISLAVITVMLFGLVPLPVQSAEPEIAQDSAPADEPDAAQEQLNEDISEDSEQSSEDAAEQPDIEDEPLPDNASNPEGNQSESPEESGGFAVNQQRSQESYIPRIDQIKTASYQSVFLKWIYFYDYDTYFSYDGYELYRCSNKDPKFRQVKDFTRSDTQFDWVKNLDYIQYTDSNLKAGNKYSYKIRAYIFEYEFNESTGEWDPIRKYTEFSDVKSVTVNLAAPNLTLTNANDSSIKVSWSKVAGANGYEIQRSTKSGSGYKTIKKITNGSTVSYTDSKLTFNKKYYYKVKAYRTADGQTASIYSKEKALTVTLPPVNVTKLTATAAGTIQLKWNKVAKANGYVVYRSTKKDGTYTKVGTIKKGTTLSLTVKGQKHATTYYYKVRAYITRSKKNYYGAYSAVKTKVMNYFTYQNESWNARTATGAATVTR